ncbi:hypothetical protein LINGRAHAP2_LOCUS6518, partial [Linum grandiflorum]
SSTAAKFRLKLSARGNHEFDAHFVASGWDRVAFIAATSGSLRRPLFPECFDFRRCRSRLLRPIILD